MFWPPGPAGNTLRPAESEMKQTLRTWLDDHAEPKRLPLSSGAAGRRTGGGGVLCAELCLSEENLAGESQRASHGTPQH